MTCEHIGRLAYHGSLASDEIWQIRASKAAEDGLSVSSGHWDLVRALQEFYTRHDEPRVNSRELHDALEERFHSNGGMKYLYELFPGGPVTQGCRLAGLEPPGGGADTGFGSVQ